MGGGGLQQCHCPRAPLARSGAGQSVVTDLGQASGQDMLQEPLDKLCCGKLEPFELLAAIVAIAKGDLSLFQRFQPGVTDGDAENVTSQVIEHLLTAACVLSMHHPRLSPRLGWDAV